MFTTTQSAGRSAGRVAWCGAVCCGVAQRGAATPPYQFRIPSIRTHQPAIDQVFGPGSSGALHQHSPVPYSIHTPQRRKSV